MEDMQLFPSEEQINMMNKEYSQLARRKQLVGQPEQSPHSRPPQHMPKPLCKSPKCGTDIRQKKLFERIYYVEQDLIMAARQLFTIAPPHAKDDIADVIKLKKATSKLILKCYANATDIPLSYAPILSHEEDYCRLLRHICSTQKQLLLMLGKAKYMCSYSKKIIQNEWTASYILTSIGMYCRW